MGGLKPLPITWRSDSTEEEYERARVGRVFNRRRPNRFPIAVIEAEKEEHVQQAVQIAQRRDLRVSVRSGGHSWAAWSVRDNAILIDLGNYKQIDLDETTGVVSVSPSTTGTQLNTLLKEKGLMFPGGHCPDVGLGGFLLQGGMGWVCRVRTSSSSPISEILIRVTELGLGMSVRKGNRRSNSKWSAATLQRDRALRPLLGRPRSWTWLPRHCHQVSSSDKTAATPHSLICLHLSEVSVQDCFELGHVDCPRIRCRYRDRLRRPFHSRLRREHRHCRLDDVQELGRRRHIGPSSCGENDTVRLPPETLC